jgi:hypothetical protein
MAHAKDSLGRNVTMPVEEGQGILELAFYYWPEKIYDNHQKKRILFEDLMRRLDEIEGLKMIYKLNAHVLVETEEVLDFYSLKYVPDALRLINLIIEKRRGDGINDCLYSRDGDTLHRKYLYQRLTEAGYDIRKLYKHYSR